MIVSRAEAQGETNGYQYHPYSLSGEAWVTDTSYAFPSWIFISVLPFFQAVDPYVFLCHGYSSSSVSSNIRAIISTMFVCILSSAPSTALLICFFSSMIL